MAKQVLNNSETYSIHRSKHNANYTELYDDKLESSDALTRTNTDVYAPTSNYHPATKLYVDGIYNAWVAIYDPTSVAGDAFDRANHSGVIAATVVTQTSSYRFVSDAEKVTWNAKEAAIGAKNTAFNVDFGITGATAAYGDHLHTGVYEPLDTDLQAHLVIVSGNPHAVTKAEVALANVDNTTDAAKPVSTAGQAALDLKRDLSDSDFGDTIGGNYTTFSATGTMSMEGSATTWEDKNYDPTNLTGNGTDPSATAIASTGLSGAGFSGSATDEVEGAFEYPHKAKLNAAGETSVIMSFHCHILPINTSGGNVRIGVDYIISDTSGAVSTATSLVVTEALGTVAWVSQYAEIGDVAAPEELGSHIHFRFYRLGGDGLDTSASVAIVQSIGIHYEADKLGSESEYVK